MAKSTTDTTQTDTPPAGDTPPPASPPAGAPPTETPSTAPRAVVVITRTGVWVNGAERPVGYELDEASHDGQTLVAAGCAEPKAVAAARLKLEQEQAKALREFEERRAKLLAGKA